LIWTRSVGEVETKDGKAVALAGAFQNMSARKAADAEHLAGVELTRDFYDNAPCGCCSPGPISASLFATGPDPVAPAGRPEEVSLVESVADVMSARDGDRFGEASSCTAPCGWT
jgi:hypothetical protein